MTQIDTGTYSKGNCSLCMSFSHVLTAATFRCNEHIQSAPWITSPKTAESPLDKRTKNLRCNLLWRQVSKFVAAKKHVKDAARGAATWLLKGGTTRHLAPQESAEHMQSGWSLSLPWKNKLKGTRHKWGCGEMAWAHRPIHQCFNKLDHRTSRFSRRLTLRQTLRFLAAKESRWWPGASETKQPTVKANQREFLWPFWGSRSRHRFRNLMSLPKVLPCDTPKTFVKVSSGSYLPHCL